MKKEPKNLQPNFKVIGQLKNFRCSKQETKNFSEKLFGVVKDQRFQQLCAASYTNVCFGS